MLKYTMEHCDEPSILLADPDPKKTRIYSVDELDRQITKLQDLRDWEETRAVMAKDARRRLRHTKMAELYAAKILQCQDTMAAYLTLE